MKKYSKYILSIIGIIIVFTAIFFISKMPKEYSRNYFYMNTYINIKMYVKDKNEVTRLFDKADEIYKKYQKLTDAYNDNSDISYINNNNTNESEIEIDEELYNIIELSLFWYEKSYKKFNVNIGKVIKIWKKYRDNQNGIPTKEELTEAYSNINDIVLLGDNKIKNNNPNIDLGGVAKGYATQKVADMLKDNDINNFIINAGGNVVVGKAYKKESYSIGIEDPKNDGNIYQVVKGNDISVVTSGGYQRFYEYEGIRYHHIIDPDTLFPANNMLSVTVVTKDSAKADILSTVLFLLPVDKGLELVNGMDDVEAIFYVAEDNIIKSEGFSKYE